jgi:hypothetical protein
MRIATGGVTRATVSRAPARPEARESAARLSDRGPRTTLTASIGPDYSLGINYL